MPVYIPFSSIVEKNGLTIYENRSKIPHNIPIGTLVLVKVNAYSPAGSCSRTEARWFVTDHCRDCDGTPLYSVCAKRLEDWLIGADGREGVITRMVNGEENGIAERFLTPVELTDDMHTGRDVIAWPENE